MRNHKWQRLCLPSVIVTSGAILQERRYTTTGIDDDTLLAVSATGYSNDILSLKHFERFSANRQHGLYRLHLLDGYGSHCAKELLDFCDNHGIIPFFLPPHTTHILQPLDVVVFQLYKHYHAEAIDAGTRTGCSDFNKLESLAALTSIREQAFKETTVLSTFQQTGLIPFNPEIVLSQLGEATSSSQPGIPTPNSESEAKVALTT